MNMQWKLIVGLGNKNPRYEHTYHNVGFFALDFIRKTVGGVGAPDHIHWLKPHSFMNNSGGPVAAAVKRYGVTPSELLVVHDDSDLPLGGYKLSFGRGSAGHKGIQDIIEALGTKAFWRLRIGIRPPENISGAPRPKAGSPAVARRAKAGAFVLKKMTLSHTAQVEEALAQALKDPRFAAAIGKLRA